MRNLEKNLYELEVMGFTVVEDVISSQEVRNIKENLKIVLDNDEKKYKGKPGKQNFFVADLTSYGSAFYSVLDNDIMHKIYSEFLSDTCILYTYCSTILRPNEEVPPNKIHMDTPRFIPNYSYAIQMTIALDDFTEESGATYFLPGSHKSEMVPSEETFNKYAVSTARRAGGACFFNARTYHRATINKSDKIRYGVSTYAVRSFMKQRFDFPRMIPPEYLENVSERVKRFLGFDVRLPSSQDEFYVPEEKRLYKANQG